MLESRKQAKLSVNLIEREWSKSTKVMRGKDGIKMAVFPQQGLSSGSVGKKKTNKKM